MPGKVLLNSKPDGYLWGVDERGLYRVKLDAVQTSRSFVADAVPIKETSGTITIDFKVSEPYERAYKARCNRRIYRGRRPMYHGYSVLDEFDDAEICSALGIYPWGDS